MDSQVWRERVVRGRNAGGFYRGPRKFSFDVSREGIFVEVVSGVFRVFPCDLL